MKRLTKTAVLLLLCLSMLVLSGCQSSDYKTALGLMEAGDYKAAAEMWTALGDYKDAGDQLSLCKQKISYLEAEEYLAQGEIDQAYNAFIMLGVFEDSEQRAAQCLYMKADMLFDAGQYSEAAELYAQLGDYEDAAELYLEAQYLYADSLISRYSYERARSILEGLGDYKDTGDKLAAIEDALSAQGAINNASVGEIVYFGTFEQDNKADNGAESLAWVVLSKDEDKMLLLCRDAIATAQYNSEFSSTGWEQSSVRAWLNGEFLDGVFTEADSARLLPLVDKGSTEGSKVFLLSAQEAESLLAERREFAAAVPSQAAEAQGAGLRANGAVCWWLRDSGFSPKYAAYVNSDGSVNTQGIYCDNRQFCLRPAIWVRLSDIIEAETVEGSSHRADAAESEAPWQLAETPDVGDEYINSIIFMGDSTTYGYVNIGMSSDQIWSASSHTMSIYEQSYVNIDTAEGLMPIRTAAEHFKPDMMVITLGIRRITIMDEELFKTEYTDLVTGILEASPDTKIILNSVYPVATHLDRRELDVTNDMIDTVNGWIQDIVQETGVRYLDSNSILKGEDGYMVNSYARTDGLHLAQEALLLVLENIRTHAYQ